jgi:lipoate-protein ligase A
MTLLKPLVDLIIEALPQLSGTELMERDRLFYSQFHPQHDKARLRFYGWPAPTLSIGRFQKLSSELETRLQALQIPSVRRPTGGSAILHAGELTFSLVAPADWLPGSILASHALITQAVKKGLAQLGIQAEQGLQSSPGQPEANCFARISPADLAVQNHHAKLVGTAQVRRRQAFLMQGMLYLEADQALMQEVFENSEPTLDLKTLLGYRPEPARVAETLGKTIKELIENGEWRMDASTGSA